MNYLKKDRDRDQIDQEGEQKRQNWKENRQKQSSSGERKGKELWI